MSLKVRSTPALRVRGLHDRKHSKLLRKQGAGCANCLQYNEGVRYGGKVSCCALMLGQGDFDVPFCPIQIQLHLSNHSDLQIP